VKRLITLRLGLGPILTLAACSLIAGMIGGSKALAIGSPPPHSTPMPTRSCPSGFTLSAGPQGYESYVYTCTSGFVACPRAYYVVNSLGGMPDTPGSTSYRPRYLYPNTNSVVNGVIENGVFVFRCAIQP